jgi:hypothetical protein
MKKLIAPFVTVCLLLASCTTPPDKAFGIAALNCNMIYGFGGAGMQRELASPSVKLVDEKTMVTAPMLRKEMVEEKIKTLQSNYEKVKALSAGDDAKEMITASLALYEYVLPVYKKEYIELAALYDGAAASEKITALEKTISDTYAAKFEGLYKNVIKAGTAYAEKHGIPVTQVNTSPR